MAYYKLEPFGDLVADQRHGVASALLANINRNSNVRPEPYRAEEFIHWCDTVQCADDAEPTLLDDPVAQSNLIRAAFGRPPT